MIYQKIVQVMLISAYFKFHWRKELKDSISIISPVPSNIDEVDQIDNFIRQILKEKGKFKKSVIDPW